MTQAVPKRFILTKYAAILPGVVLCSGVALAAQFIQSLEEGFWGRPWLEALVLAILLGTVIRAVWTPGRRWQLGIGFCAKFLLEAAVVCLGASISFATLMAVGPALLAGIGCVVAVAIVAAYAICRMLGLGHTLAILVACGNSICGNSAIAAIAPVIAASSEDVACAIGFTAVLGVAMVLGLPLLVPLLGLTKSQYGTLAGLTVYAVPQVIAATVPIGGVSSQVGTLVKLVRVLMLGPVVLVLSLLVRLDSRQLALPVPLASDRIGLAVAGRGRQVPAVSRHLPSLYSLVPWFIVGFLALAAARSAGAIPASALPMLAAAASILTVVSMAALGLGVDVRIVARSGAKVVAAVLLSLLTLVLISLMLIYALRVA